MHALANTILDHQSTGCVLLDEALAVVWMNPAAEALLATSASRCLLQPVTALFDDPDEDTTSLSARVGSGGSWTRRAAELTLPGGSVVTADYTVTALQPPATGLLLELVPLDRLKRINQEEQRATLHETTRQLVRGLAHEIKNPLGGLRGAAQLLQRAIDDRELTEYTEVIIAEADRLRGLVDRLLGPSRPLDPQPTNIHRVLDRVQQLVAAEHPRVHFVRDYDPSLPDIPADADQLIQAMLNIVSNAALALAETDTPCITLRTRAVRQMTIGQTCHRLALEVVVQDNGPGVPGDLIDGLFYPMISGRADGTGLGLSIAQLIVQRHEGLLTCASVPGDTRFTTVLPAAPGDPQP